MDQHKFVRITSNPNLPAGHSGIALNTGKLDRPEGNPGAVYISALAPSSQKTMISYLNWSARQLIDLHNKNERQTLEGDGCNRELDAADFLPPHADDQELYAHFSWNQLSFGTVTYLLNVRRSTWVAVGKNSNRAFKQVSNAALRSLVSALKGVVKKAVHLGWISAEEENAIRGIQAPSPSMDRQAERHTLTNKEIILLIEATAEDTSPHGVRDAALLSVLLGMGIRRDEVGSIDVDSVNQPSGRSRDKTGRLQITFKGKGDKVATLPVPNWAQPYLKKWMDCRDSEFPGPLFVPISVHEEIKRESGLTGEGVAWILEKRLALAGVNPAIRAHDLRRTFGVRKLEAGMDLMSIKELMRHSSVTTTQRYLQHFNKEKLYEDAYNDPLFDRSK